MNRQARRTTPKRLILLAALLALVACVGPAAEGVERALKDATAAPTLAPATPTTAPATYTGAPLLLIGWDDALGRVVRAVDPLTGADAPGYAPLPFDSRRDAMFITPHALAPNGQGLAILDVQGTACYGYAGGETCGPRSSAVHLVDVAAWSMRRAELSPAGWAGQLAYSPDSRRLAVAVRDAAIEDTLSLIDVATGETLTQRGLPFAPSRLGYTADGAALVAYGQPDGEERGMSPPPPPRVLLLDATTLATVWEITLDEVVSGHWCAADCDADHGLRQMTSIVPGVALSADGATLLIAHADGDRLTMIDLARHATRTVDVTTPTAWLLRLLALTASTAHAKGPMDSFARTAVLSPDGARLYVGGYDFTMTEDGAGGWSVREETRPLRVLDTATGRVLAEREASGHDLRLTPDGEGLLLLDLTNNETVTTLLDARTLEPLARAEGLNVVLAADVAGQLHPVAQDMRHHRVNFSLLDPLTLTPVAEWAADGPAWLAIRP